MKRDLTILITAVAVVLAACYALDAAIEDRPLTPSKPFVPGAKSGHAVKKDGKVVMHVNGEPVTEAEFNAFADNAPAENRMFFVASAEGRRLLAQEIVKLKALEQEATRLGIADDPEVRTQIAMAHSQIMAGRALEKLVKAKVEQQLQTEFERERANSITLRHIVVAYQGSQIPPKQGDAPSAEQAMQKANAIAAQLRGGANFAQMASNVSDDSQSAMNGGMLGATRREGLPPEITAAVGNLQPGQISNPVRTQLGIHIFRVDTPTLEDVRPALTQRAQQQAVAQTVETLQKRAKVELDPQFFQLNAQQPAPATKSKG